jgi:hypothetical protein
MGKRKERIGTHGSLGSGAVVNLSIAYLKIREG